MKHGILNRNEGAQTAGTSGMEVGCNGDAKTMNRWLLRLVTAGKTSGAQNEAVRVEQLRIMTLTNASTREIQYKGGAAVFVNLTHKRSRTCLERTGTSSVVPGHDVTIQRRGADGPDMCISEKYRCNGNRAVKCTRAHD